MIAQLSGIDWNSEKLQKYVSDSSSSSDCRSSGTSSMPLRELVDLLADRPEQVLGVRALLERQVAAAEQVHRHVERLLRVVIGLERVALRDRVVGLDQVDQRLLELVLDHRRESFSSPKPIVPSTLKISMLWYADTARPLSEMMVGWSTPASSHTVWM